MLCMKRWLMRLIWVAPAALTLLLIVMWWQGYHGGRRYLFWTGRVSALVGADSGQFRVIAHYDGRAEALPVRAFYFRQWRPERNPRMVCFFGPLDHTSIAALEDIADMTPDTGWPVNVAGLRFTAGSIANFSLDRHVLLEIPYWMPAVFLVTLMAIQGWQGCRKLRRVLRQSGTCAACGYDLRATRDRCPECGSRPTAGEETPRERLGGFLARVDLHLRRHAMGL